ncbi:hypothetical protein CAEBREN_32560 [Caenorhabditis brenneri]|uniref:Uncharacterized protein n=1 Tax=Caenorhabditis brenneri TaxID=135651 RepID=G0P0Y5_CAEBE|nr:hypothetical protein CAEBREN_32560 [Caenorhabditis brenneri]
MDSDEVRKRKEYAERKVKERHAALRKEAEERRKHAVEHRERVQSVLKREQVLLQKRMQQLNEDEERKKATLAKQHEATSRIAAITKSPKSFAFGSSTPRTLAYLDNLPKSEQQYDKKLRPLEDSSQVTSPSSTSSTTKMGRITSTPQRPPPAAHRPAPAMTSMTSSMYVTSSAPPTRHAKTIVKSTTTTTTTKRLSNGPSMMTQSVYTPTSRPATTTRLSMGGRSNRGGTPISARPTTQSVTSTPVSTNNRRSLDSRKPPMPRKSVIGKQENKKSDVVLDIPAVQEEQLTSESSPVVATKTELINHPTENSDDLAVKIEVSSSEMNEDDKMPLEKVESVKNLVEVEKIVEKAEKGHLVSEGSKIVESTSVQPEDAVENVASTDDSNKVNVDNTVEDVPSNQVGMSSNEQIVINEDEIKVDKKTFVAESPVEIHAEEDGDANAKEVVSPILSESASTNEHEKVIELETPVQEVEKEELLNEETSESHLGSTANTSLAEELVNIGVDQNDSHEMPSKQEVIELEYPILDEQKNNVTEPVASAANDLVDVFGNDFINQNRPQRIVEFDEDTDSGKASPTSSETSSTTDEVTPRSVIEEVKPVAPRVLPLVRSAEDMARKEKEAKEAEERKNRLAAILAKSRGMASPMTNTLPPTAADIKESGRANDVLARVAAMTNSSTLQKILQRKQGSNPSLQTSESTGGEIY